MYYIKNLFIKNEKWKVMVPQESLWLQKNWWILWDINASADNPRQVLISCEDDIGRYNILPWKIRENICISGDFCQKLESGDEVRIWNNLKIRITYPCEPCNYLTKVENLPIKNLWEFEKYRWRLGYIISSWEIKLNDKCTITKNIYASLPKNIFDRFLHFADIISDGEITNYLTMIKLMWVADSYVRAMPRYISKSDYLSGKILPKDIYNNSTYPKRNFTWIFDKV